jgi:hypothetical protein
MLITSVTLMYWRTLTFWFQLQHNSRLHVKPAHPHFALGYRHRSPSFRATDFDSPLLLSQSSGNSESSVTLSFGADHYATFFVFRWLLPAADPDVKPSGYDVAIAT